MKSLTVYYSVTFEKYKGKYYCNGAFGRFLDSLASNNERMLICVPVSVKEDANDLDYEITSKNLTFQELPNYRNMIGSIKYSFNSIMLLIKYSKEWDNLYIRWPSPYTYIVYLLAKIRKVPVTVHIVGDTKSIVQKGSKYKGLIKLLAILFANQQELSLKRIIKGSRAIVNGNGMRRIYKDKLHNVREIRSSTFSKNEIFVRNNSCTSNELSIIYVGYLRHEKGVNYLIDALQKLVESKNKKVNLVIVGDGEERERLENQVKLHGLENNVNFKGHVSLGIELFRLYRESDIFVLPSISEGTPRVLIEAMANGVPVIATNVGGVPYTIKDGYNGILVEPEKSDEIYSAICKLIRSSKFRNLLIHNGYEFAQQNTLEAHVSEVASILEEANFV